MRTVPLHSDTATSAETEGAIVQALLDAYGIDAQLSRLSGESLNYRVSGINGEDYIVNNSAYDQSESLVEMEFLALRHASARFHDRQLPQNMKEKYRNAIACLSLSGSQAKRLRFCEFISGSLLDDSDISEKTQDNLGMILARFEQAMHGFDHPAAHRIHRWDLTRASQHEHAISLPEDTSKIALPGWAST